MNVYIKSVVSADFCPLLNDSPLADSCLIGTHVAFPYFMNRDT